MRRKSPAPVRARRAVRDCRRTARAGASQHPYSVFSGGPLVSAADGQVRVAWTDSAQGGSVLFTIPFGALGQTFGVDLDQGLGGAPAALLIGVDRTATPIVGGTVLVAPLLAPAIVLRGTPGVPGAGAFSLPLRVPNGEVWVGQFLLFQAVILDPGAPGGASMSNGLEVWFG